MDNPEKSGCLPVTLRPATHKDWAMIQRWLRQPDIEDWWGPSAATEAEVLIALQSPSAISRIIMCGTDPVGYGHAVDAQVWGADLPQDLEPGTWDLDLFIAARQHRGRGVGETALRLLKQEVFSSTLALAVCVFAPVRHEAIVRLYEKAGFRWQRIWAAGGTGHSWFMVSKRPQA
jgi:RimJ/RimL family protein N-acetyltransferase